LTKKQKRLVNTEKVYQQIKKEIPKQTAREFLLKLEKELTDNLAKVVN
jgi:hypothetical protein